MNSGVSGAQDVDEQFFTLRWVQCSFHKKRAETHYVKHVCLHHVGSVGHVVCSGASEA
jgi:hypothetical protein